MASSTPTVKTAFLVLRIPRVAFDCTEHPEVQLVASLALLPDRDVWLKAFIPKLLPCKMIDVAPDVGELDSSSKLKLGKSAERVSVLELGF